MTLDNIYDRGKFGEIAFDHDSGDSLHFCPVSSVLIKYLLFRKRGMLTIQILVNEL